MSQNTVGAKLNAIQKPAIAAVLKALKTDGKALLQAATGTGKTNIAVNVYSALQAKNKKVRVLWVTHTNELVEQSGFRFQTLLPGTDVGLFYGKDKDTQGQVTVASVQSISKKNNLEKFSPNAFDYIFVDEAHHTPAVTWDKTLNYFSKAKRFGFTATPYRPTDTSGDPALFKYFGPIISEFSLEEAQKQGVVAKIDAHIVLTNSILEPKFDTAGDYARATLDRLWTTEDRGDTVIRAYKEYGRKAMKKIGLKYKTICYCINSNHAENMVKLFEKAGIKAALLVGDANRLKATERKETYDTFLTTNDIEVLCVVNILNEGADINDVGCMLMCRPTKSNIVYTQQVGRGVRVVPKYKEKVVLIDFVDNTEKKYLGYNSSNLPKSGITYQRIVTKYLKDQDPVVLERRVEDVMASIREFENQFRKPRGYWTLETCLAEALKYKTLEEWKSKHKSSHLSAWRLGILKECSAHMPQKQSAAETKKQIKEFFRINKKLPPTRSKLGKSLSSYIYPGQRSFDPDFIPWVRACGKRISAKKPICREDGKVFESGSAAARAMGKSITHLFRAIKQGKKYGGYHWAYCDKNGKVIKKGKKK